MKKLAVDPSHVVLQHADNRKAPAGNITLVENSLSLSRKLVPQSRYLRRPLTSEGNRRRSLVSLSVKDIVRYIVVCSEHDPFGPVAKDHDLAPPIRSQWRSGQMRLEVLRPMPPVQVSVPPKSLRRRPLGEDREVHWPFCPQRARQKTPTHMRGDENALGRGSGQQFQVRPPCRCP